MREWVSGGVSGSGPFSECFALDSATHWFLLTTHHRMSRYGQLFSKEKLEFRVGVGEWRGEFL